MKRITTVLFSMAIATGTPVVALAADNDASRYNLVYSTADFSSSAGVEALHKRILDTAKSHCPSYFVSRSMSDTRACVRDVVSDLVRVINNPMLTAYAEGRRSVELAGDEASEGAKS